MGWTATAESGYEVSVEGGAVVCRNAAGKKLRSVPPRLKDDPAVQTLRSLLTWLPRHEAECREQVERWMVRSLPVPAGLIVRVWADEAWRAVLRDLVVVPVADDADDVAAADPAAWDRSAAGFLRSADERGVGLVDLDGETVRPSAERFAIPHPVLLPDLADLREFGVELDVRQSLEQLYRETFAKPAGLAPNEVAAELGRFAGGSFPQLWHLAQRAGALGYTVRGGYASCRVYEGGQVVDARTWLGEDYYEGAAETGPVEFADRGGRTVPFAGLGPVAWSEGLRMAAALYAGRMTDEQNGAQR